MFEAKRTVLETLASIGYDKEFMVTFQKSDGTWRTMRCKMPVPDKPKFGEPKNIPACILSWNTGKLLITTFFTGISRRFFSIRWL